MFLAASASKDSNDNESQDDIGKMTERDKDVILGASVLRPLVMMDSHHSSDASSSAGAKNPSHSINHDDSVLGKVREHFPFRLYDMLEYAAADDGLRSIVTWSADGRSFSIHQKDIFMEHIVPKFFKITKFRSFVSTINPALLNKLTW